MNYAKVNKKSVVVNILVSLVFLFVFLLLLNIALGWIDPRPAFTIQTLAAFFTFFVANKLVPIKFELRNE